MSPRTEAQFEAMRAESREKLLDAALTLFAEHGYARTSVRMIAREAGVSQGLLYNYFESKHDLLRAIYRRGMQDVAESFARGRGDATARDRLETLLRGSLEIAGRNRRFWILLHGLRHQPAVLEELGADVAGWTERIVAELESLSCAAGAARPEIEARVLFALIDGLVQHYVLDPDGYPVEEVVAAVLARYFGA